MTQISCHDTISELYFDTHATKSKMLRDMITGLTVA